VFTNRRNVFSSLITGIVIDSVIKYDEEFGMPSARRYR